ncbi:M20 family metallopeptidase [Anaeropeptidivorans aminofermentans]|jgi:amidohydrolase|uniref:M20 family metallopeptidase n=1 Tax=Anaeropeptidivorans aminofermentans TaxID=2934315 RepID=UPI002024EC0A|nr:M20 family metallopeptidase [Anaeropeptidivorans aminofermentans]MBE6013223.1 M20 family metallopeptidase [Lachnospiraceae bacterium]
MKEAIFESIEEIRAEILELSKNIHENPELAFDEYKSAGFIKALLQKHGFSIEDKSGGMDTAFKARFKGNGPGVTVAFLAEYDALPGMGHACGHNLIAAASTGAAIGLSKLMKDIPGEIVLMGTPGEEGKGGKIILLDKGEFDDIDYSLMTHPSTVNLINRGGLATTAVTISYTGKAAHSAAPESGINALQAVIQTFNLLDSIRARMPLKTNINGIILKGGEATNIIPGYAECAFSVRAATFGDLKKVVDMIKDTVKAVELFTGATAAVETDLVYSERYSNLAIDEVFKKYMELQGEVVEYPDPNAKIGSSDIGNVSLKMPAIHAYIKIAEKGVVAHNKSFAEAAITDRAQEAGIKAAKALAATAYEILTDENLRKEIKDEFDRTVPVYADMSL